MNPRILKKLSARAAPLLPILGDHREQFRAEKDANFHGVLMPGRQHWRRSRCHASYIPTNHWGTPRGMPRRYETRAGRPMVMRPPSHPLRGTVMVGATSGGEQPEWDEETAYESLLGMVWGFFLEWSDADETFYCTRCLRTPREVFAAAREVIAADAAERAISVAAREARL